MCILLNSIHTYHSRFISEEVAEASQIFLRDAHVLPKLCTKLYNHYNYRADILTLTQCGYLLLILIVIIYYFLRIKCARQCDSTIFGFSNKSFWPCKLPMIFSPTINCKNFPLSPAHLKARLSQVVSRRGVF
jgi:hypothetical protein